jgi:hypothetical protein
MREWRRIVEDVKKLAEGEGLGNVTGESSE